MSGQNGQKQKAWVKLEEIDTCIICFGTITRKRH